MKHLLLILFVVVGVYTLMSISDDTERKEASKFITKHVLRLGFLVIVLLLIVAAAASLPSTSLI